MNRSRPGISRVEIGVSVMRAVLSIVVILSIVPVGAGQTVPGSAKGSPAAVSASSREAGAILANQCVACHGPEKKKGGLDLSRRATALTGGESGAAIVPGRPDESLLVEKVAEGEMPPKGGLSKDEVAAVRAWVEAGAPYPSEPLSPRKGGGDWWSLRPIRPVAPPARARAAMPVGSARRSTRSSWPGSNAAGLRPAPEADRADPDPPRHLRPDRPAPDSRGGRRVRERPEPAGPMKGWSTGCWPRPTTASAGAGTGWTSSGSARARATRPTCRGPTRGRIATT